MLSVEKPGDWKSDGFARPTHVSYQRSSVIIKGALSFIEATSVSTCVRRHSKMVIVLVTVFI